jgi:hypothetical protein
MIFESLSGPLAGMLETIVLLKDNIVLCLDPILQALQQQIRQDTYTKRDIHDAINSGSMV